MNIISLVVQLASGAAAGNIGGALFKGLDLGSWGNSVSGILGGIFAGGLVQQLTASANSELNLHAMVVHVLSGGLGGSALMAIAGWMKSVHFRQN
jgi:hypothetical protein